MLSSRLGDQGTSNMNARPYTFRVGPVSDDHDFQFKAIVVGDSAVGKSCFLIRLTENYFRDNHITTIGVDFKVKTFEIGTHRIKANIWDTAGTERFRTLSNCFYRGARCVVIAFSLTDRKSFDSVTRWVHEVDTNGAHGASKLLIGTKADLADDRRVAFQEAKILAERMGMLYAETSARTGEQIEDSFIELISEQLDKEVGGMTMSTANSDAFQLTEGTDVAAGWCSSCYGVT